MSANLKHYYLQSRPLTDESAAELYDFLDEFMVAFYCRYGEQISRYRDLQARHPFVKDILPVSDDPLF